VNQLLTRAKRMVPGRIRAMLRPSPANGPERELGDYLLAAAKRFSASIGGDPSSLDRTALLDVIGNRAIVKQTGEAHQFLQTAFLPDYENNLYTYYEQQQFMILLAFLSYPLRGPGALDAQLLPYAAAARRLPEMHVLDYGAGIPFGLIHLLRTQPGKVRSVTLCDLDLVHAKFARFVVEELLGAAQVRVIHSTDPNALPNLAGNFNFVFGKDIFEHLLQPEAHLRNILSACADRSLCYLDFTDHGERYLQHVTPLLSPLAKVMEEHGFTGTGPVASMSGWSRGGTA
jgi:SAM-dependent methyltransferase